MRDSATVKTNSNNDGNFECLKKRAISIAQKFSTPKCSLFRCSTLSPLKLNFSSFPIFSYFLLNYDSKTKIIVEYMLISLSHFDLTNKNTEITSLVALHFLR
jgi:hypothetical protein